MAKATNYFKVSAKGKACAVFPFNDATMLETLAIAVVFPGTLSVFRFTPAFPSVPVIGVGGGFAS